MEVYKRIKEDLAAFFIGAIIGLIVIHAVSNQFNLFVDDTDLDGWNRSGFRLLKDHGTGRQYLYKNGALIERGTPLDQHQGN